MRSQLFLASIPGVLAAAVPSLSMLKLLHWPSLANATTDPRQQGGHGHGGDATNEFLAGLGPLMQSLIPALSPLANLALKFMPTTKAATIEEIPPILRKDAKRIRITYGPYTIKGAKSVVKGGNTFSLDPSGTGYQYVLADFPKDVTILDTMTNVYDEKKKLLDRNDGLYNHHNVFMDMNSPPIPVVGCGEGKAWSSIPMNLFMGSAADAYIHRYTTNDGKFNSGFYIGKDDAISMNLDIVNYKNETRSIYSITEIEYLPGKIPGFMHATNSAIDLGMCSGGSGGSGLFVYAPKGQSKFNYTSKDLTIGRDGYLLNLRGHMHDGGVGIVVSVNGKDSCTSKAIYGGEGHEGVELDGKPWSTLRELTICDQPIKVKKGDKLGLEAQFDMEKHPAREQSSGAMAEAMALMSIIFAVEM